jgi:MinD superfamily P-loop ATPase
MLEDFEECMVCAALAQKSSVNIVTSGLQTFDLKEREFSQHGCGACSKLRCKSGNISILLDLVFLR